VVPGIDPHVADPGRTGGLTPRLSTSRGLHARERFTYTLVAEESAQSEPRRLHKQAFRLAAEKTVEFSAVALNFVNHANWNDPDAVIGPADAPNINAGRS